MNNSPKHLTSRHLTNRRLTSRRRIIQRIGLPLLALASALLAACVTQPIPLQGEYTQVTPRDSAMTNNTGTLVRWGGRIVQVEPHENRTCFEMISTQLNANGRPAWASDDIGGRFIACRTGFYDPALFQKNREVTFTGRIDGYETRKIGGYDYRFAHIAADVVYLWPERDRVDVITRPAPWPWWGYW